MLGGLSKIPNNSNHIFNTITNPLAAIAQNNAFLTSAFKPIGNLFGAFGCLGSTIKKALTNTIKNCIVRGLKTLKANRTDRNN